MEAKRDGCGPNSRACHRSLTYLVGQSLTSNTTRHVSSGLEVE
jgi:hypothetical protein